MTNTVSDKIYIIILNYNTWQDTIECLESIVSSDYKNYQIIVVDNCSCNNSAYEIKKWIEESKHTVIFIQTERNLGFAGGNNTGIRYVMDRGDYEYIWLLNNDTVIERDALTNLVLKADTYKRENKKVGIVGSNLLCYDKPQIIQGVGGKYNKVLATVKKIGFGEEDKGQYNKEEIKMDFVIGASMFVRRDFINEVGVLCENYFLYFEELDWVLRGQKKGWEVGYCYRSRVYHKEGKTVGVNDITGEKNVLADYYNIRNRIIFTKRFYPWFLITVYLSLIGVFIKRIIRGSFRELFKMYQKDRKK